MGIYKRALGCNIAQPKLQAGNMFSPLYIMHNLINMLLLLLFFTG